MNFKNKRLPGKMALWLAACALIIAADIPAKAEISKTSLKGPGVEQTQETGTSDKNADTAAADITQAIVVDENGGFHVTVSYYKKQTDGTWTQSFQVPGIYGRNGGTDNKQEGDGKTPYGTYSFTMAFGTKENPGSILPYHQIQETDFWIDDSNSAYYNKLVNIAETPRDWNSGEDMSRQGVSYHYGLALNYNEDCVPGKGSAIFLHCYTETNDSGSAGCIRIPEDNMKQLIQSVDANTRIIIRKAAE